MKQEIKDYMARIGRKGGKSTSEAKAEAARANAKKGGWPKGKPRKETTSVTHHASFRAIARHSTGISGQRSMPYGALPQNPKLTHKPEP